jgi:hypothetical protein
LKPLQLLVGAKCYSLDNAPTVQLAARDMSDRVLFIVAALLLLAVIATLEFW